MSGGHMFPDRKKQRFVTLSLKIIYAELFLIIYFQQALNNKIISCKNAKFLV